MSHRLDGLAGSEPLELLRRLSDEPVPGSAEDASKARRDRLVRGMKDAVERSAERAEKAHRLGRGLFGFAAAAGFLLLSGLLLKAHLQTTVTGGIAGIDRVSGAVVLTQNGVRRVVGSGEQVLHDGDALQTATGAHAHIATAKSSVGVSESTELRVSRPSAAEERISLRLGRVDVSVDKTVEAKRAVVVETPNVEVVVRGTVFDVRVEPAANATITHVHVTRGSVWVLAQGAQVALLSAGQSWSSLGGVVPVAETPRAQLEAARPPVPALSTTPAVRSPAREPAATRRAGTLGEENRLFAAAVEARNRGDAARAAELFGELLGSYPQGALREATQVERFRALSRAGQSSRAASEARRYLAEHPGGSARDEARRLALEAQK